MNTEVFNVIHDITGFNSTIDSIVVFCAQYLLYILLAVAALSMAYLVYKKQWRPIIFFGANLVVTLGLVLVASHLYPSLRPFVVDPSIKTLIDHAASQSFPSHHAAASFAVAFGLVFFTRLKGLGLLAIIAAGTVGLSRIAAGVHWPLDIAGAIAVSLAASILVGIVYRITKPDTSSVQFTRHD